MAEYSFTTRWHFEAPIEDVWDAIFHVERWPSWWQGVESAVELQSGGPDCLGSLWRYTWKSALPNRLTFYMRLTRVEPPVALDGVANGELGGEGLWRLFRSVDGTLARYEWNVKTAARWMNLLAPLARPLFARNHDVVMRQGGAGLAGMLAGGTHTYASG